MEPLKTMTAPTANSPPEAPAFQWVDVYQKHGSSWVFRRRVETPEGVDLLALRNRMCRELAPSPAVPLGTDEIKLETMP